MFHVLFFLSVLTALLPPLCNGHSIRVQGAVEVGDEIATMLKQLYEHLTNPHDDSAGFNKEAPALLEYLQQFHPEVRASKTHKIEKLRKNKKHHPET